LHQEQGCYLKAGNQAEEKETQTALVTAVLTYWVSLFLHRLPKTSWGHGTELWWSTKGFRRDTCSSSRAHLILSSCLF